MKASKIKSDLAFASLALLLPVNSLLTIYNAHYKIESYFLLREAAVIPQVGLMLIIITQFLLKKITYKSKSAIIVLLFLLMIIIVVSITASHIGETSKFIDQFNRNAVRENFFVFIKYAIYFFIGVNIRLDKHYKIISLLILIMLIISVLYYTNIANFRLDRGSDYSRRLDYLFVGDAFAIWSIFVISYLKKHSYIYILSFFILLTSFFIGSRAAFFFLFAGFTFYMHIKMKNKLFLAFMITVFFIMIILYILIDDISLLDNRMLSLLLLEDASLNSRSEIFRNSMDSFKAHWLQGRFAAPVLDFNNFGSYIHNHLSLWHQFGLIPFLISVFLFIVLARDALMSITSNLDKDPCLGASVIFLTILSIFLLLEIILARSYAYPYIWLCIGFLASLRSDIYSKIKSLKSKRVGIT